MTRASFAVLGHVLGVILIGSGGMGSASAQQPTPIKDILVSPSAYHRQTVVLRGKVRMPGVIRGYNAWGQQLCGQEFVLEDEGGQLPVMYLIACRPGHEREWMVRQGEAITVEATMEAAPSNMKTVTGRGLGTSAVAQRIIREDRGGTHLSIDPIR